jgi:uncharacterized protein (TIGR02996 family)
MRTFQFSDAKSHKFWNIEVKGNSFTVTYGKIGTAGQSQTKTFPTPEKAQAEADKLVKEKTGKGYVETTPKTGGTVSEGEAFEKTLLANPHDGTGWRAYADFLAERDDPRGEFMQVQLALEDESLSPADRKKLGTREAALLKKHEREWLGPLAEYTLDAEGDVWPGHKGKRPPVEHTFARGWLNRVVFHNLKVNEARALAKCPGAKLLRELVVETCEAEAHVGSKEEYIDSFYEPGPDVPADVDAWDDPGLYALCRCPHLASVTRFQLGEGDPGIHGKDDEYPNCHISGELAHSFAKQMPNIEELYLLAHAVDANKLFVLPMPKLRALQLYHSNRYPLEKLAANKTLTNLEAILCHPHALDPDDEDSGAYIRLAQLKAICRSPHLPKLTHLRLRLTDFGDKGAREIVDSGILKRLKVLDLQGGCMTDDGAKVLAACPDLKNLEFLNLRSNALTKAGADAIKATRVKADTTHQHGNDSGEFGDGETPEYLFEGDIE